MAYIWTGATEALKTLSYLLLSTPTMKRLSSYLLLLTFPLVFAASCKKEETLKEVALSVHVQSSFNADNVIIYIDNQKQFDNQATTIETLGFAGGFSTVVNEGRHWMKVIINNKLLAEEFTVTKAHYIGIHYDKEKNQLSTMHSDQPFAYD
jgi:hypothetical protein